MSILAYLPRAIRAGATLFVATGLAACSSNPAYEPRAFGVGHTVQQKSHTQYRRQQVRRARPRQHRSANYKLGRPYTIRGKTYVPRHEPNYNKVGRASWYGLGHNGRRTANGEIFDDRLMTAAHPTLPLPSLARVTNLDNGRQVVVRINDRGPFIANRIIDLTRRAARELGYERRGGAPVRVQFLRLAR